MQEREGFMSDLLYVGFSLAFFVLSAVYAIFCEKVR